MQIEVREKVALVTGASRGIGLEIARALGRGGARVAIVSRKPENLAEAKASLEQDGVSVETFACHVGKAGAAEPLVQEVVARLGKIDVLVNNAATNPQFGPLVNADDAVFDKTFETNARAYFSLAREVARHLVARDAPGAIIHIASTQGLLASPLMGVYGMTKAAVISLTKTLAVELGPSRIRVNCIAPGLVETRFAQTLLANDELVKRYVERAPLGRVGRPEEIAGLALYLASDASSYLTGQTIVVDGGFSISPG